MRAANRFSMLALGLAVLLGLSATAVSLADDAPTTAPAAATGTVSGKVLDATGNAAKGVTVSAFPAPVKGQKRVKGQKPEALSTATTADDGTFKLLNVPAGDVVLMVRSDGDMGRAKATVTAGQDTPVKDIKLKARKARKAAQ